MALIAFLACVLLLAVPSFQQPQGGYGGNGPIGGGRGNCGYLAPNCRARPGEYNTVFAYTFDNKTQACVKVSVYNTCANGYGASSNIFQTLQACNVACDYNNRGY
ncbi:unnamed protein product [Lymnaea stagnalis]|uniref:Uncharacterized protein n=1 Tax=Lymnaea stagnalis TaxID=6523 RepID=A0AAV2HQC8_LYMST